MSISLKYINVSVKYSLDYGNVYKVTKSYLKLPMSNAVKIDPELLKRINVVIRDKAKRIRYSSAKQFVNIAVLDLLEKEEIK